METQSQREAGYRLSFARLLFEVAWTEGLNRTARELHVAWDDLKRRVATSGEVPQQPGSPAFVELVAPQAQSSLCIGMDAVDPFRNALALDPDEAELYEFFALAASSSGLSSLPIEKANQISAERRWARAG
jgi:hypothetical protein